MKLTEDHYRLLKAFPADKSYLTHKQIEDATNERFDYDRLFTLSGDLHYADYLNGSIQGVGLRITDEGLLAIKNYEETTLRQKEIAELNFKKLKYDVKISERIFKTYFSTRLMAIIGSVVAVVLLFLKLAELIGIL